MRWLTQRDEAERGAWVQAFCNSEETVPLGQIVKRLMAERQGLWNVDQLTFKRKSDADQSAGQQDKARRIFGSPAGASGQFQTVPAMANGFPICAAWNKGACKAKCPNNEEHVCNRKCKGGRACGMRNHTSEQCQNRKRL